MTSAEQSAWGYSIDLDGTLYKLKPRAGTPVEGVVRFGQSEFAYAITSNAYTFLQNTLGMSEADAIAEYERIYKKYDGEISLAVEQEYNIDRYTYFNNTWDLDPKLFITPEGNVREALSMLEGRMALLTSAPRIWAIRALTHLKVDDLFITLFTGEPDIRKAKPEAFMQVATALSVPAEKVVSVGDQQYSDIDPAESLGMKGLLIGRDIASIQDLVPKLQEKGWI